MKPLEKINLLNQVARELQAQLTFADINIFFRGHGIEPHSSSGYSSKYSYCKDVLAEVELEKIFRIAEELELNISSTIEPNIQINIPEESSLWKSGYFRLFLSHISSFKGKTHHLKKALEKYCITSFVAHDDIEPTKEWQIELEKALFSMEGLVAILTKGFNESQWTDQEVGIAMGRKVLIIPIKRDMNPYGFFGKYQGLIGIGKSVDQVAKELFQIIAKNELTKKDFYTKIIALVLSSNNHEQGLERILLLEEISEMEPSSIERLHREITDNENLNNPKIIQSANRIFKTYEFSRITKNSFDKGIMYVEDDDLPF